MKYFIDTEFLEGSQKESFPISLFRKQTPNTIDLISIGIVAEDGREYYAISKDFNLKEAWNRFDWKHDLGSEPKKVYWLRENVLRPIFYEFVTKDIVFSDYDDYMFLYSDFKRLLNKYGKTNKQIAKDVEWFCSMGTAYSSMDMTTASIMHFRELGSIELEKIKEKDLKFVFNEVPEFYAYYADYDHVCISWLYGSMINLPSKFPKYTIDIQQIIDEYNIDKDLLLKEIPQTNCHNALQDAKWNKQAYEWIQKQINK